ncbi:MAG: hypothetical protein V4632_21700 [Pseudomonadota bacterium]
MKRLLRAILALGSALLAVGCDQQGRPIEQFGLEKLGRGVSTESDVRTVMGQPDTVWEEEGGARSLEYPKGPAGHRTWVFAIGSDGKLTDYQQVLTEENFAKIKPGISRDTVRKMLGKPRSVVRFGLKNEEVWDWLYLRSGNEPWLFNVHFDIGSGNVTQISSSDPALAP